MKKDIPHSRPYLNSTSADRLRDVIEGGQVGHGPEVKKFEQLFAKKFNLPKMWSFTSCAHAITSALRHLGVTRGTEVVIPTYVCREVLSACLSVGAEVKLCDVGSDWHIDRGTLGRICSSRTRVIIFPHLFGIHADIGQLKDEKFKIIEDFAQCLDPRFSRVQGDVAVFSFSATKCLTAGEGGGLALGESQESDSFSKEYDLSLDLGRMSDLSAGLASSQLEIYDQMLSRRRHLADRYLGELKHLDIELPFRFTQRSMFFRFPIRVIGKDFARIQQLYSEKGIAVRRGVDALLHRTLGYPDRDYPGAVKNFSETVSLPIYPSLTDQEQDQIISATQEILS